MNTTIMMSTLFLASTVAAAVVPPQEVQIASAVLAAPPELREGVAVLGYNPQGEVVKLPPERPE
jgi:hypothetical protein